MTRYLLSSSMAVPILRNTNSPCCFHHYYVTKQHPDKRATKSNPWILHCDCMKTFISHTSFDNVQREFIALGRPSGPSDEECIELRKVFLREKETERKRKYRARTRAKRK